MLQKTTLPNFKDQYLDIFITVVSSLGHLLFYIQAYKIFSLQSAYSVSFPAFCISFISMLSWLGYGIVKHIKPLVISNIVGLIGASLTLTGIILYGDLS